LSSHIIIHHGSSAISITAAIKKEAQVLAGDLSIYPFYSLEYIKKLQPYTESKEWDGFRGIFFSSIGASSFYVITVLQSVGT
jgi:hypothetical protein